MQKTEAVNTRVPPGTKRQFANRCASERRNQSDVARWLITLYAEGKISMNTENK